MHKGFNTIQPNTAPIASFYALSAEPQYSWLALDHLSPHHHKAPGESEASLYETANPIKAVIMGTDRSAAVVAVEPMPCAKAADTLLDDTSSILYSPLDGSVSHSECAMSRSQSTMSRSEGTICESCVMDEPAVGAGDIDNSQTEKESVVQQGVRPN